MQIYTAMKRIVHKEQSQRGIHLVEGFCARIMEPASEPRAIEVRCFFLRFGMLRVVCAGIWVQC